MALNQEAAAKINENSKKYAETLHRQYETIDKYKSIQKLKQSSLNDPSTCVLLKNNNPKLFASLENLPDNLPKNAFKVTLKGPIQLPDNSSKIAEIDKKIQEIKATLPDGVNLEDLPNELENFKLKDTDTKESIEAQMASLDKDSDEYKKLEMKRDHLALQDKIKKTEQTIEQLHIDIRTGDTEESRNAIKTQIKSEKDNVMKTVKDPNQQAKMIKNLEEKEQKLLKDLQRTEQQQLKNLAAKKQVLAILKNDLSVDEYSKSLKSLEDLQRKADEIKKLLDEKTNLEEQTSFQNLDSISSGLETSSVQTQTGTLATVYNLITQAIERRKENEVKALEEKHKKLPLEKNQDEQKQDPHDGR